MKKQDTRLFSVIMLISIIITLTACHSENEVKAKIEEYLMGKYEEEFVVDRIGTRTANE